MPILTHTHTHTIHAHALSHTYTLYSQPTSDHIHDLWHSMYLHTWLKIARKEEGCLSRNLPGFPLVYDYLTHGSFVAFIGILFIGFRKRLCFGLTLAGRRCPAVCRKPQTLLFQNEILSHFHRILSLRPLLLTYVTRYWWVNLVYLCGTWMPPWLSQGRYSSSHASNRSRMAAYRQTGSGNSGSLGPCVPGKL